MCFQEAGQHQRQTETAIQTIQYTLSTHQSDLQGLHAEIQSNTETLGRTLQSSLQTQRTEIANDVNSRFDRLEALLAKRQKTNGSEWLGAAATSRGHGRSNSKHQWVPRGMPLPISTSPARHLVTAKLGRGLPLERHIGDTAGEKHSILGPPPTWTSWQ